MDTVPADKHYTHESEITFEEKKEYEKQINSIKSIFHNYGILEGTIFDQLRDNLSDL